jgi:hypothetical protein
MVTGGKLNEINARPENSAQNLPDIWNNRSGFQVCFISRNELQHEYQYST